MKIRRDLTAINRSDLSRPVQLLIKYQVLGKSDTFFDYGCGYGDDIKFLSSLNYTAEGWDPAHRADITPKKAQIVNLGYVLNVIENIQERTIALKNAFKLAEKCLCVAVLVGKSNHTGAIQTFQDGLLTSRGTFQKYFQIEEIATFLLETTGVSPIPAEAGIFFLFKHTQNANLFLLDRIQTSVPVISSSQRERKRLLKNSLIDSFQKKEDSLWKEYLGFITSRGRPPATEESKIFLTASHYGLTNKDLWDTAALELSEESLNRVKNKRYNQYLIFIALGRFRQVSRMSNLSQTVQRDIRFFFGSFKKASEESYAQLLKTGDKEIKRQLSQKEQQGINTKTGYFFSREQLESLHPVLQIYTRLGELFYGDLEKIDIIKIHKESAKLSFFSFDSLSVEYPQLLIRIKIDLQAQTVRLFDHKNDPNFHVLIGKQVLGLSDETAPHLLNRELNNIIIKENPFGPIIRIKELARLSK